MSAEPVVPLPRPFLGSGAVTLRPLVAADADGPYLGWFNDAEVCRWNAHHVRPYTREMALEYIAAAQGDGPDLVLAIEVQGAHVGNVSLQEVRPLHRTADLAIVVGDRTVWGTGVGAAAAALVVDHGFGAMNLHRITAATFAENVAMRRLAEKLGMVQEGVRREALFKHGRHHDVIEYGLLASERPRPDAG
jgi:RimJ/RimL family protein N-acetyltransferase